MRSSRTKYFKGEEPILTEFEDLCRSRHLHEGEILNELVREWVKANNDGQTTLSGFPQEPRHLRIFDKAALIAAKNEISRNLDNIERASPENRGLFQEDLAKALRGVEPLYMRTHDPALKTLLEKAEDYLK